MRLKGRVAIVTGGGAGLGRAVAVRLAKEGAKIVIGDINPAFGNDTVSAIRSLAGEAVFFQLDVGGEKGVGSLVECTQATFGRIDILHNNAAVLLRSEETKIHELPTDVWEKTFQTNALVMFLVSKYVIPQMLKQDGGVITMVGSPTALNGCGANVPAYTVSKGAVMAFARAMAIQYAPTIRVNCIVPGTMNAPMNASLLSSDKNVNELIARIPLGRLGTSDDIAGLSAFLASDESAYCTGGVYLVDGGLTAY